MPEEKEKKVILRIGPAGWSYKDWEGIVYPQKKWRGFDPLAYLSEFFDTIEVNSTFYALPRPAVTRSWAQRVAHNRHFKFTLKLWRVFTHERTGGEGEALSFLRAVEPLAQSGRLGAILLQFPWSFKNTDENRSRIERLAALLKGHPLVLEVRHASWDREAVVRFLNDLGMGFCNIDQPLFSKSLGPTARISAPVGYVRLHGRNYADWFRRDAGRDARYNHLYTGEELAPWVEKIRKIVRQAQGTYVITNNHFQGKAVCNALELRHRLENRKMKAPSELLKAFKRLEAICEPPMASLF
jgi:uncharacterized protein YecE (DUF72 family)